jgi:hypothetical protein
MSKLSFRRVATDEPIVYGRYLHNLRAPYASGLFHAQTGVETPKLTLEQDRAGDDGGRINEGAPPG